MFLNCQECIEGLPLDPRFHSGRYHLSSCDYCSNKPTEIPPTSFEIPLPCTECPTHNQFLRLRGELEYLKTKVTAMRARKQNEAIPFK